MSEQKRVFVAIDISDEVRQKIAAYIRDLMRHSEAAAVKFERPEKLHLTLKFLGDIDPNRLENVVSAVYIIAGRHDSFALEVAGTGVFPNAAKPRILWLGIRGEGPSSIVSEIDDACRALGFPPEKRDFKPHLTMGRVRQGDKASEVVRYHLDHDFAPVRSLVTKLSIYESRLLRTGSVYTLVSSHRLR